MNDRQEVYESRRRFVGNVDRVNTAEMDKSAVAKQVAEDAKIFMDAFLSMGFSIDISVLFTSQVLSKLL